MNMAQWFDADFPAVWADLITIFNLGYKNMYQEILYFNNHSFIEQIEHVLK